MPINVNGLHVVVTGTIVGESRRSAEAKLQDAGAIVQRAVNAKTQLLITGDRVGAKKVNAARSSGITIVQWSDLATTKTWLPPQQAADRAIARAKARQVAPQLAKNGDLPTGDDWLFEVKWDGYRGIATVHNGAVTLQSRSGKSDLTQRFPKVVAALSRLENCVLDGELVDLSTQGGTFEGLQNGNGSDYVVFDLLEYDGQDVRHLPLEARREMAAGVLRQARSRLIHLSPAFDDGEELLAYADEHGLEGIVAKRRSSPYREGTRTEAWLKIKLRREQEFIVVGWTPGEGARQGMIGSLVLAVWQEVPGPIDVVEGDGGWQLVYAGRAGSGIPDGMTAESLGLVETDEPPVADPQDAPKGTTWVEHDLVVQVAFQRWTEDGRLWHPSFKGVRHDKHADDVVRET